MRGEEREKKEKSGSSCRARLGDHGASGSGASGDLIGEHFYYAEQLLLESRFHRGFGVEGSPRRDKFKAAADMSAAVIQ